MTIHIYDTTEKESWHHYLERVPGKDVYFTPEYAELYEKNGEGKAFLLVYEEGDSFIYYPFLKRALNQIPFLNNKLERYGDLYDLTTPYGYGGPITNADEGESRRQLFERFTPIFEQFCQKEGIVTEFLRFHPLLENHKDYTDVESIHLRDTIHIDLTLDWEDVWSHYDSPNRNRIRKAKKKGLKVIHKPLSDHADFQRIYRGTMQKLQASSYYYFSEEYFQNKADLLSEHAEILEVVYQNEVAFSGIFMSYGDFVHYDLVGSNPEFLKLCPNNFVIDYAAQWAKSNGRKYLHLGGGYAGEDSLFKFKKRFNKYGDRPFHIGKRIHNKEIYQELTAGLRGVESYFPLYRHPSLTEVKKEVVG
ncbi:GNAT family N-acetyltransferase [Halobacillus yeomjeoni]|uniref:lipid II:glycine glycyltransferase FemX n=1 Tax=Halobacillus yeomjeoni TaxID=311194 RepID=UPI001CD47319|nr:GNAT family N-acetyltransferase [Halobacillus yeomjeoni]MCA0985132.1 GNAT family N-acetyltransferase [Halobacillus yeomjeoni]